MVTNNKISEFDSTSEDGIKENHVKDDTNSNFNYLKELRNIDKIIYNLDQYSNGFNFGLNYENMLSDYTNTNTLIGGKNSEQSNDSNEITISLKKYKKIKEFAKVAKKTIIKYKNLAKYYFDSYNKILYNYMILLGLLNKQKAELENKVKTYQKLSSDYSNGIEKIKLLETMIGGVEKIVAKTVNLDLDVKNKINSGETSFKAVASLTPSDNVEIIDETKTIGTNDKVLLGGDLDFYDFETDLNKEIDELNKYAEELKADNDFIEQKVESLHSRVKNIMGETEDLLNIRLSIEWIVNQLEKPAGFEEKEEQKDVDYQSIFNKLKDTIDKVKQQKVNTNVAKYVRELESMAKYFEDFIASNKETLQNMSEEKRKEMLQTLKNIHGVSNDFLNNPNNQANDTQNNVANNEGVGEEQLGGGFGNKFGGGLNDEYNKINVNITNKINTMFGDKTNLNKVIFIDDSNSVVNEFVSKESNNNDLTLNQDKLYQIFEMGKELNKIFLLFTTYIQSFEKKINFGDYWNNLFKNKKTNFYTRLKDYDIINISQNNNVETQTINFNDDLRASDFINQVYDMFFENGSKKNTDNLILALKYSFDSLDNLIKKINDTTIFYYHFVFMMIDIKFFYLSFQDRPTIDQDKVKSLIELYNNLTKSSTMYKFNEFYQYMLNAYNVIDTQVEEEAIQSDTSVPPSVPTNVIQEGGDETNIYNILTNEQIQTKSPEIKEDVLSDLYDKFNESFSKLILKPDLLDNIGEFVKNIYKDIGKTIIEENKKQTKSMRDLMIKISRDLGKEKPETQPVSKEDLERLTIEDIVKIIESNKSSKNEIAIGGTVERPRITPYKNALEECYEELLPLYQNSSKIERYLDKKAVPQSKYDDDTKTYVELYSKLKYNLDNGTNSLINVNPMIFFTIEFPPSAYVKKDSCQFNFTFDKDEQKILYNPPTSQKCIADLQNKFTLSEDDKQKLSSNKPLLTIETNQPFLKSVGNNNTLALMTDPVIGLNKLIDAKPIGGDKNLSFPTQKVINLMFALGASGTGKTTRYFGKSDAVDKGDRVGVVQGIVEKAKKSTDGNKVRVEMGYFVSYGRKKNIGFNSTNPGFNDNQTNDFDELIIFADIEKVNKKMEDINFDGNFNNEDFYIFKQNVESETNQKLNYTQFYSNIVSKKLQKINYNQISNYIEDDGEFPAIIDQTAEFEPCSFREIIQPIGDNIEKYKPIWFEVSDDTNLSDLFENLIKAQKCIKTVLPTKNNIESSRGHTCVLIKIIKVNADGKEFTQYFPLFDMAGTENVLSMNEFLTQKITIGDKEIPVNEEKIDKLIRIVSNLSKDDSVLDNEFKKENKNFASLTDVLTNIKVQQYVEKSNVRQVQPDPQSGGKGKWNIDEVGKGIGDEATKQQYSSTGTKLIQKILGEGYYINHTIGMLIYIAKCIGCSINSTKTDTTDYFDNIENEVINELIRYVYYYTGEGVKEGDGLTRILLNKIDFNTISKSSTIWIQVLLSFLYWNEENKDTFGDILNILNNSSEENPNDSKLVKYLAEQLDTNNINPEAPGNTLKYQIYSNETIEPTYNQFFNNLYSINMGKKINLDMSIVNAKVDELKQIYPEGTSDNDKNYTLSINENIDENIDGKLTFTNKTIEAYKAYIKKGDDLSEEDFYNELKSIIDENKNSTDENYIFKINLPSKFDKKNLFKNICSKPIKTEKKNKNNEFIFNVSCNFNIENIIKLENTYYNNNEILNNYIIDLKYIIIQRIIPNIKINVSNFNINVENEKKKYVNNSNLKYNQSDLLKKLFNYNENKTAVLDYIKNKIKGINFVKANEYKNNEQIFKDLIKLDNNLLFQIAKNFNSNLHYSNGTLVLYKDGKKSKNLNEIVNYYNKLLAYYNASKPDENFQITSNSNQIQRVKDVRIGATKMVMMHVVTGQDYKYPMVKETIDLTNVLFSAVKIDLTGSSDNADSANSTEQTEQIGGSKHYKINYDFIELID